VVEQNGNVVTFVDVLTHAFILRRRAAGNRPKEIEQEKYFLCCLDCSWVAASLGLNNELATNWISFVTAHLHFQEIQMLQIHELVQSVMASGYLTIVAEEQLRQLLQTQYDKEDLKAFIALQYAAMCGDIQQESRLVKS
jgi:hypothetical protein